MIEVENKGVYGRMKTRKEMTLNEYKILMRKGLV